MIKFRIAEAEGHPYSIAAMPFHCDIHGPVPDIMFLGEWFCIRCYWERIEGNVSPAWPVKEEK